MSVLSRIHLHLLFVPLDSKPQMLNGKGAVKRFWYLQQVGDVKEKEVNSKPQTESFVPQDSKPRLNTC